MPPSSSARPQKWLLATANLLLPLSILIFATGFFPYKPFMSGLAQWEHLGFGIEESIPEPVFDKVVFMVVDALRTDFVFGGGSAMSFVQRYVCRKFKEYIRNWDHEKGLEYPWIDADFVLFLEKISLVQSGHALPFTAHATSPTITMPRVKAITTGSIPSFLDVILNFAESDTTSSLATQDTWLAQLKAKDGGNGKLVMYGDDTWLKLFPGFFEREDGTSSFFVAVSTES